MDRTAARHFLKTASVAAIDTFTRARFLEGMAGVPEGRAVRNQSPSILLGQVIPDLIVAVLDEAQERTRVTGTPADVASTWTAPGNTRLYERVLAVLTQQFGEDTALEALARALVNEGGFSSVWEAGKLTGRAPAQLRRFATGDYAPVDATKIILSLARRDAIDVARVRQRRKEIWEENASGDGVGAINEGMNANGYSADEWESMLNHLTDSNTSAAREFWEWVVEQAEHAAPPVVVAYFERLAAGEVPRGDELALEFGVSEATVSKAKNAFVSYLAGILAHDGAENYPEVLDLVSDAHFYSNLQSGRVRGPVG